MEWTLQSLWRFVVEITILSVTFYYAFMFIRGTRGWPVVIGFTVILGMTLLSGAFRLEVLSFLLQYFLTILAVAVLVIFQPELRRMLAELGNLPLFYTAREQRENIEVFVQAAERLAEARIGALMAIEQSIQLQEVV